MLFPSKDTFEEDGTKVSIAVADEVPVVSVTTTDPSPVCKDSEKYKSNFVEDPEGSHAPFKGEYGMFAAASPVRRNGVGWTVAEHLSADSVVKVNDVGVGPSMYISIVEDDRYALKQLLGIFTVIVLPAFNPPDRLMGTSTTLLNHCAVGLLQPTDTLLASSLPPTVFAVSPTVIVTEAEDFCTVSEKVNTMLKSLTGTTVVGGKVVTVRAAWAWLALRAKRKIDLNIVTEEHG